MGVQVLDLIDKLLGILGLAGDPLALPVIVSSSANSGGIFHNSIIRWF
jgi:hypothetical protein